jgi:LmbE family N-acetylglucosaminyl deacetylase
MTVLAVGGHPSDIFPNIGGTVAKHVKWGDDVVLLTLTYGVEVHTEMLLGKSGAEIKEIVRKQSIDAAKILGVDDYRFLDFGDTPLVSTREKLIELGETIQDIRPDIIISAHYPYRETGWGGDHGVAARMLEAAPSWRQHFGKVPHHTKAIWFSTHDHTTSLNHPAYQIPNVYVDITDTIEEKIQACITTWALPEERHEEIYRLFRQVAAQRGLAAGVEYAEPFERPWLKRETVECLGY